SAGDLPGLLPVLSPSCHRDRARCSCPPLLLDGLGGLLLLLLEGPDLEEGLGAGDVGDRASRILQAVVPGCLAPPGRRDAVLLAQQGEEDLRLLGAEAGQLAE